MFLPSVPRSRPSPPPPPPRNCSGAGSPWDLDGSSVRSGTRPLPAGIRCLFARAGAQQNLTLRVWRGGRGCEETPWPRSRPPLLGASRWEGWGDPFCISHRKKGGAELDFRREGGAVAVSSCERQVCHGLCVCLEGARLDPVRSGLTSRLARRRFSVAKSSSGDCL